MSSISVEIVPRDKLYLKESFQLCVSKFPQIDMINIPDLPRFPLRSWDSCGLANDFFSRRIPHIRSIDFHLNNVSRLLDYLKINNIDEILIINGDAYKNAEGFSDVTTIQLTKALLKIRPNLKIYAGLDPYRWSLEKEVAYSQEKLDAGVVGFFTQPFFDLDKFLDYKNLLPDVELFLGVSPVLDEKSLAYWQNINKVTFPQNFSPTMEWNINFARQALDFIKKENLNIYFMPIKIDFIDYFSEVF